MRNTMISYGLIRGIEQTIFYLSTFMRDRKIASVTPSSRFAVNRICSKIDFCKDVVIVECGPGNGVLSLALLKRMSPDSRLILIERNNRFVEFLRENIKDPRVHIFHDYAINIASVSRELGITNVDYAILGIPFSFTDHIQNHIIIARSQQALKCGGKLLVYQYSLRMRKYIRQHFKMTRTTGEVLNIPPMFIFEASQ